jgi:hypothetical protein
MPFYFLMANDFLMLALVLAGHVRGYRGFKRRVHDDAAG